MFKINRKFIYTLPLLSGFILSTNAFADEYLTSKEIRELLSGNSMTGIWNNKEFKQNIHSDGIVVVNVKTMQLYNIPWIANERNEYCEYWGEWGWGCYKLKKISKNKYLSIRTDTEKEEKSTWTIHPGFIDINM